MGWVVRATLRLLYSRERPGAHCVRGCVGPCVVLDGSGILWGFGPPTLQPVGSRYPAPSVASVW